VPRKNGKSVIAAGVGIGMFVLDDEFGAEVYSGATSEKQAWEVFRPAQLMVKRSPMLVDSAGIEVNASNMNKPADGSRFEPIIGNPGDGASPSCAIVDEYHEHDSAALYETMLTGMGARRQPLMFIITTAGANIEGPCFDKRRQVIEMLEGRFPTTSFSAGSGRSTKGMIGLIRMCWRRPIRISESRSIRSIWRASSSARSSRHASQTRSRRST
jgi:phage terminase large subunit-like protein